MLLHATRALGDVRVRCTRALLFFCQGTRSPLIDAKCTLLLCMWAKSRVYSIRNSGYCARLVCSLVCTRQSRPGCWEELMEAPKAGPRPRVVLHGMPSIMHERKMWKVRQYGLGVQYWSDLEHISAK
jgi:hypothetical protein